MIFRTAFWLFLAAILAVGGYIVVKVYQNQIEIEEIAVWDGRTNELRLAATMPSCGCLTLTPTGSDMPEMMLEARLNDSPTPFARVPLRKPFPDSWVFAFDWAGSDLGDRYHVQAVLPLQTPTSSGNPSTSTPSGSASTATSSIPAAAKTLDMSAYFKMSALPQRSCDESQCRFGELGLNKALAENVGQNAVASAFTGVRVGRNNRVIEAQATGRHRGAPGDCGCMLLDVFSLPTEGELRLTASISGASAGNLTFRKPGALVRLPFDYGGTRGDDAYVISVEGGERQITDYVRVLGHLDGMECSASAAEFLGGTGTTGGAVAATGQTVTSDSVTGATRLPAGAPTATPTVVPAPGGAQASVLPERFDVLRLRCPYTLDEEYKTSLGIDATMNLVRIATKLTDEWMGEWVFQNGEYKEAGKLRRLRTIDIKSDGEDKVSIDITAEDGSKIPLKGRLDGEDHPLEPGLAAGTGASTVAFRRTSDRGWRIVLKNNEVVTQESTATVAPDGRTMRLETLGRTGEIQGTRKIEVFERSEKARASPSPR